MMHDLQTMIWKEWREIVSDGDQRSRLMSLLVTILLLGVLMPLQQGETWLQGGAVVVWAVGPVIVLPQMIADVFAGERDRHTLETLLASRLPDRVILFGKVLMPVLWAWIVVQIALLVAVIPVSLLQGAFAFYPLDILALGLVLSALTSVFVASAGTLVSLRASSVRQAQQYTGLITISLVVLPVGGILLITLLPESVQMQAQQAIQSGNWMPLVMGVLLFFGLLDAVLLWLADYRFQRSRLILD